MPRLYTMTAEENYPQAIVDEWLSSTQPNFCCCDKQYVGTSFDRVRRNIMYSALVAPETRDAAGFVTRVNATGQTLWPGPFATSGAIPNGNKIDLDYQGAYQTAIKNIDSGTVTFYDSYDATKLVPAAIGAGGISTYTLTAGTGSGSATIEGARVQGGTGNGGHATIVVTAGAITSVTFWDIGFGYTNGDVLTFGGVSSYSNGHITLTGVNTGSDGTTWGRVVADYHLNGGDVLAITDPRNGNFWVHMQSCELHLFQPGNNFAMTISPLRMPFTYAQNALSEGAPIGVTTDWVYFWAYLTHANGGADPYGSNKLQIIPSSITAGEITADELLATYTYDYPDNTYAYRQIIGPDGYLYAYGSEVSGRAYKLWKCVPGTGFSELTPWTGSTGPNTNIANYIQASSTAVATSAKQYVIQLPASLQLGLISKFLSVDYYPFPDNEPDQFRLDCTYYDMNSGTFDYHEGFITGYVDAALNPVSKAEAAFGLIDFLEFDNDLECSDYVHAGVDYSVRRFMFIAFAMSGGVYVDTEKMAVFADYKFVYGAAPELVQVIPEYGWDFRYTQYATAITQSEVVAGSLPAIDAVIDFSAYSAFSTTDNGIWLRDAKQTMWLSGDAPGFCKFNTRYAPRYTQSLASWATGAPTEGAAPLSAASPPFLKLQVTDVTSCVPMCIGKTFTSKGQILRPVTPQEGQTQSGPGLGKLRRMTYAGVLLNAAQGVSMGVDFLTMRSLAFKSPGGTVDLTLQQTFSGVHWAAVDAEENYDNMWCWQITRPYPCTVVAVECQHKTNENL